jgi:hypothetical protein
MDIEEMYSKLNEAKTWNLVLKDTFDNNNANWTQWNVDDWGGKITRQIENGVFLWGTELKQPDQVWYQVAPVYFNSDFYYSIKIRRIEGRSKELQAYWGMHFRSHDLDHYEFRINDIQEYSVQIRNKDSWIELIGWTSTQLVELDEFNELTVIAEDADLYFFINGTPIGMVNDQTYSNGNVGILAGLIHVDGKEVLFEFDDFELRHKPEN